METKDLKESIDTLEKTESKLVSLKWNLYRGIFYGLGFFIGGTILVAFLLYILSFFDTAPIVGEYVSKVLHFANVKVGN